MYEFFPGNYSWSYTTLLASAAGAEIGDLHLITGRLAQSVGDTDVWHREWSYLAKVAEGRAEASGASSLTASGNYFLACLYHTIAEHFVPPAEPRRLEGYARALAAFEKARARAPFVIERVEVPYDGVKLPAYFVPGVGESKQLPAVIFLCGLDTTKEISYLRARQEFSNRGMHCLFIDTPGVGEALRFLKLPTRYDYERPVSAAIDYLQGRADVAADKIGILGSSLGGYYVARSAAFEPRLKAAVAWGGIYDYHAVWKRRFAGGPGAVAAPPFQLMYVTGTQSASDALEHIENFKVSPIGERIKIPFLILHGADDRQVFVEDAKAMFDSLASRVKQLVIFDGTDGGVAHCQFDNHRPALQRATDWMQNQLQKA